MKAFTNGTITARNVGSSLSTRPSVYFCAARLSWEKYLLQENGTLLIKLSAGCNRLPTEKTDVSIIVASPEFSILDTTKERLEIIEKKSTTTSASCLRETVSYARGKRPGAY